MSQIPDDEQSLASCLCRSCPSRPQDEGLLYCVRGKSQTAVQRSYCACNWCPVWSGYGLDQTFFCAGDGFAELDSG